MTARSTAQHVFVAAIIRRGRDVVIVRERGSKQWLLPTGPLVAGEDAFAAVKRIAQEQLGLNVEGLRVLDVPSFRDRRVVVYVDCFILGYGEPAPTKGAEARWTPGPTARRFLGSDAPPYVRRVLASLHDEHWRFFGVVDAFLLNRGRLAIFHRGDRVGVYRGKWGTVAGHLPPDADPLAHAYVELREEVRLRPRDVRLRASLGPVVTVDESVRRVWAIFAFLFTTTRRHLTLDWEHTEMRWIPPEHFSRFDHVPGMASLFRALARRR